MRVDVILSPDTSPGEVRELGLLAEGYGINAVWSSNYPSSRDPFLTLAPLALASTHIRLGPLVITAYEQHPFKTAKALATLNELCHGRANILIGGPTGVNAAMGMGVERMVGRVRESVEVVKADRAESMTEARQQLALRGMLDTWYLEEFLTPDECSLVDRNRNAFFKAYKDRSGVVPGVPEAVLQKLVDHLSLAGTPADLDQHIERLLALGRLGLNEVALKLHDDQAAAIRLIGERVVPALH